MSLKNIILSFGLVLIATAVLGWVGSDPVIKIVSPDSIGDADTLTVPVNIKIQQLNTAQGIDYGQYWLVEEDGSDTYINAAEWATRVVIPYAGAEIDDINREAPFVIAELGVDDLIAETYYYVVGIGKDLNGDYSSDSTLIPGVSMDGDANISDSAIVRFYMEDGGSDGITRYLHWSPSYNGYALSADGGNNDGGDSGIIVAFSGTLGDSDTTDTPYIEWSSTTAGVTDYDVIIRINIPTDYRSMGIMTVEYLSDTVLEDTGTIYIYDSTDTVDSGANGVTMSSSTWNSESFTLTGTYTAGDLITIKLHLECAENQSMRIGEILIAYKSKDTL